MSTVLITGGNGRTARHLIEEFLTKPNCPNLRVLVRPGGAENLQKAFPLLTQAPHAIVMVDYMDERSLGPAFQNATVVVHNGPSVHQLEAAMATSIIDAAKNARVQHFVLCSVLHPMRTKLVTHRIKLQWGRRVPDRVADELHYSPGKYNPTHYMQNVSLSHALRTGKVPLGYSPLVEQGFLDLRDFTSILRRVILDPGTHKYATYELVSQNMPYTEVAKILQDAMRRNVECDVIPIKEYIGMMKEGKAVQSEYAEDAMERIMIYHDRWGLVGNSNVLRWLLGREPKTWKQYAADMMQDV